MAKVVIITGGGRGIGAAAAVLAAEAGYDVAVNYRSDEAAAMSVVGQIEARGRRAVAVQADMARESDVVALFEAVDAELGRLDGLVNNAGVIGRVARLDEMDGARIDALMRVNVIGALLCAREAVKRMSTRHGGRGGAIVNMSSIAARLGGPGEFLDYATSKGAVDTMTVGLAREVAAEGIRVNAVRPGLILTEIHASAGVPDRAERLGATVPIGRAGTPEEVAETILWLLSDKARYVTGTLVDVSGGR
jgi:NAD(P)-dependent dehydrogenase (short-subunit alcohol dehydrogenase family)